MLVTKKATAIKPKEIFNDIILFKVNYHLVVLAQRA